MGLGMLMARDRLPNSAYRYQRLRGELGDDGGCPSSPFAAGSVRVMRPLRLRRRRACGKAAGRWKTATGGGKRLLRLRLAFLLPAARRVAALFAELVRRLSASDCRAVVFSSQWGHPVLSHSARTGGGRSARLRAFYLERSLSARSSSGAGSPC
jgi:hypothetical protein